MKTPVLFLDFDGVLNNTGFYTRRSERWKKLREEGKDLQIEREREDLAPENLAELAFIMASVPTMKVVVSSTWRLGRSLGDLSRLLIAGGVHPHRVLGVTPRFGGERRGKEIQAWLDANGLKAEDAIILDDDTDMEHLMPRLVYTPHTEGLTRETAKRVVELAEKSLAGSV